MTFGQTLRAARVGAELSQDDLAFLLDVSHGSLSKYEADLQIPSREVFDRMQAFLDDLASVAFPGYVEVKPPGRPGGAPGRHKYPPHIQIPLDVVRREYR